MNLIAQAHIRKSTLLCVLFFCSKSSRALTFENFSRLAGTPPPPVNRIAQLKAEVQNEDLSCGKEKDKNFKAPKFRTPKLFQEKQLTPADTIFVRGMSCVMWFFLMSVFFSCIPGMSCFFCVVFVFSLFFNFPLFFHRE